MSGKCTCYRFLPDSGIFLLFSGEFNKEFAIAHMNYVLQFVVYAAEFGYEIIFK
jgi:hypothetical protein